MMDSQVFIGLVAFMALCYALFSKYLQTKMIDQGAMKRFQEESKKLSKELDEARKSKNQKRIDEAMKKQMDLLPQMNKVMGGQLKMMLITIAIFMGIYWALGHIDPSIGDDLRLELLDDGSGCDRVRGDGIFTACFEAGPAPGKWVVNAKAIGKDGELGSATAYLLVDTEDDSDTWLEMPHGHAPPQVSVAKLHHSSGEQVEVLVESEEAERIELGVDMGTSFLVDLPFEIPVIEFQRIRHPPVLFIILSLVFNISLSISMSILKKQGMIGG